MSLGFATCEYAFRARASVVKANAAKRCEPVSKGRKVLSPSKTASHFSAESHNCLNINKINTTQKVVAGFFFSTFRFFMAHAWECTTFGGYTCYNGARSHCGHCQAAHAALSPALYDDKLHRIVQKIKEGGYGLLSPRSQKYLNTRFGLEEKDCELLSSQDRSLRSQRMMQIVSRLTSEQARGSFAGTPLDLARNVTFENPTASNRVDCYLERHLRFLENELAQKCMQTDKSPKEALEKLFLKYEQLLQQLKTKLILDLERLSSLESCWEALLLMQQKTDSTEGEGEVFRSYLKCVEKYQQAFDDRFRNAYEGVPQCPSFRRYMRALQSPSILHNIKKIHEEKGQEASFLYFQENRHHLTGWDDINRIEMKNAFQNVRAEVERRLAEVKAQTSVLEKGFDEIYALMKMFLGTRNDAGVFVTPTKKELQDKLAEHLVPILSPEPPKSVSKRECGSVSKCKRRLSFDSFSGKENIFQNTL